MFDINDDIEIKIEFVDNSPIYTIENFYKYPEKILDLLFTVDPIPWKIHQKPTYNGIYFNDNRHFFKSQKIKPVYSFLSNICNQPYLDEEGLSDDLVITNFTTFKKCDFNDYKNNYWWPHEDAGYTGILYLNKNDSKSGTNLYEISNTYVEYENFPEHYQPWKNKKNYNLIHSIASGYNKMVLFDGEKFLHGMNIVNDNYFCGEYRMNQVFFFKKINIATIK